MMARSSTRRPRHGGIHGRQERDGWLFVSPALILLALFLLFPILMALWVSVSDWAGQGSPFSSDVNFVGADNYADLLTGGGLAERNLAISLRNNAYYVFLVVPIQTLLSLVLAVLVDQRLKGRGFFRTALYFPSVTSSVAITVLFLFLFTGSGVINEFLGLFGADGPNWITDPRGVIHIILDAIGIGEAPGLLQDAPLLGISWWEWLAGPSVAMLVFIIMAIFTTSGTFMLLFLAALQNIGPEIDEAAMIDGATAWKRFWRVTVPMLKPTVFTVTTLGLIATWQVFDQIYTGTQGSPAKTTLTPAYLSYDASFLSQDWGQGAAIAFILFAIIVVFTVLQRVVLRERSTVPRRKQFKASGRAGQLETAGVLSGDWGEA